MSILSFLLIFFSLLLVSFCIRLIFDVSVVSRDFTTSPAAIAKVSEIIKLYKKETGLFYDLGSCRGELLLGISKFCPKIQAFGVDNSRFRNFLSRFKAFILNRKIKFSLGDIYQANVFNADAVYVYLKQEDVSALEQKLQKELRVGSLVITNTQSLPFWPAESFVITHPNKPLFEKLFVYVKS